ncbi:hypothetical protein NEOLI_001571 [Neolecta irregularis DAH-3]|uniref:Uncharacterized protein n=1 Tax=Neolecta irregularis (strain DAH-3) TaxID=1198029 RepID=A0A1U7LQM7_NEOID|nr:hypothetical protein NEOLI_001571 [Neolecta irregularis DAH-3]|eukprot:OLL24821.1 hypothetical protein NEOLI_001571 [Neolecta irregularis DAH-3]
MLQVGRTAFCFRKFAESDNSVLVEETSLYPFTPRFEIISYCGLFLTGQEPACGVRPHTANAKPVAGFSLNMAYRVGETDLPINFEVEADKELDHAQKLFDENNIDVNVYELKNKVDHLDKDFGPTAIEEFGAATKNFIAKVHEKIWMNGHDKLEKRAPNHITQMFDSFFTGIRDLFTTGITNK